MEDQNDNPTNMNSPPLLSEIYTKEEIAEFVFNALMSTESDSIYIKDPLGRLNLINLKVANEMKGFGHPDVLGKTDKELFGPEFGSKTQKDEQFLFDTGKPISSQEEDRGETPNNRFWMQTTKIPLRNHEGEIIGLIGFTRSIDKQKLRETKLRRIATHDKLTNVYNRNGLFDYLNKIKQQAPNQLAVLLIDLDNFKKINDQLFHKTGDEFLKWFAWILKSTTRGNDLVARLGGDEFVLILNDISDDVDVSSFCRKLFRNFDNSIESRFKALGVSMSIGISLYPIDSDDPLKLIEKADEALYWVKNHGKGQCQFFKRLSGK